ncbi:hypothetical protein HRI_001754200 [Hibiscus trionum]|uniref:Uncharacterized protein n=1 Tax=Hibiscus trionum TaxID=183268 RepID=A0A9W7HN06_HIBTR|nr:hypothetical protein HRI_001754200 [Hibiscus trionum]
MAKASTVALISLAIYVSCLFSFAHGAILVGRVLCDPCRAGIVTEVTEFQTKAEVSLICEDDKHKQVMNKKATANEKGVYQFDCKDCNFQSNFCHVSLEHNPNEECNNFAFKDWPIRKPQGALIWPDILHAPDVFFEHPDNKIPTDKIKCEPLLRKHGVLPGHEAQSETGEL